MASEKEKLLWSMEDNKNDDVIRDLSQTGSVHHQKLFSSLINLKASQTGPDRNCLA